MDEYGPGNKYLPPFTSPEDQAQGVQGPAMPNPDHTFDPASFPSAMGTMLYGMPFGSAGATFLDNNGVRPGRTLGLGALAGAIPGAIALGGSHVMQQGNEQAANNEYVQPEQGGANRGDVERIMMKINQMNAPGGT